MNGTARGIGSSKRADLDGVEPCRIQTAPPRGDLISFDQPGYSLNSETAGIVNNGWLPVPEPSSAILLALGLSGLAFHRGIALR